MAADFASALTAKVGFKGFGIEEEKLATKAKFEYEGAEYEIGHGAQRTLPSRPRLSMLTDGFPPPVRCRFPRNRGHYLVHQHFQPERDAWRRHGRPQCPGQGP